MTYAVHPIAIAMRRARNAQAAAESKAEEKHEDENETLIRDLRAKLALLESERVRLDDMGKQIHAMSAALEQLASAHQAVLERITALGERNDGSAALLQTQRDLAALVTSSMTEFRGMLEAPRSAPVPFVEPRASAGTPTPPASSEHPRPWKLHVRERDPNHAIRVIELVPSD